MGVQNIQRKVQKQWQMKTRTPNAEQKELIREQGLNPHERLVVHDSKRYLHLTDRHFEHREACIIDKQEGDHERRTRQ